MRVARLSARGRERSSSSVMGAFSSSPATWKDPHTQKIFSGEMPEAMAWAMTRFIYASRTTVSAWSRRLSPAAARSCRPKVPFTVRKSSPPPSCSKFRSQKVSWSSPVTVSSS